VIRSLGVLCLLHVPFAIAADTQTAASYETAMSKGQAERKAAHFASAIESFRQAAEIAQRSQNLWQEASALKSLSASEVRIFQYREALQSAETARLLALETGDDSLAGAALNNKAAIYQQVGDYFSAEKAAQESVILLRHSRKDYFATALLNYGTVESQLENVRASVDAFQQAVSVAQKAGFLDIEASAQDHLGPSLTDLKDFAGAERALKEARRLREQQHDMDGMAVTNANLAYLAYRKGEFAKALPLLHRALVSRSRSFSTLSPYWAFHLEGQILQGLGRQSEALSALGKAVSLAGDWRRDALPGDATNTRTVVSLHDIYQDYIELAAQLALKQHNPLLAKQAFMVLIENRASSLREQMLSAFGQQMRLPPRYFELLSILQTTQAAVTLGSNSKTAQSNKAKLDQVYAELTDLENKIGLHQENFSRSTEKVLYRNSLRDIQRSLSGTALLLSFCLGKDKSFLWAVTRDDMNLYELPAEDTIAAHARAFSEAVQRGSSTAQGKLLTSELFGKLNSRAFAKPEWLIAADGALLDSVPFSALPQSSQSEAILADAHAIRFVPSELLLADAKAPEPQRRFVGVADPIYNLADSRRARSFSFFPVLHAQASSVTLARLVGSEREVRSAARLSQVPDVKVLTGAQASIDDLRAVLANAPEVLHFAVHVVSPQNESGTADEAALALSLTNDNMPELLTKEAIATLRVPGSLVVLSGCSSQQGENLPSAGLVGLSRAWLLAGASAVIVSAWPTPDDSGRFFTAFYKHLQSQSAPSGNIAQRAATALQQTQLDMQHSTGYRSSPSFWAAYSIISKE
jgi:CHAT domain-containing protein